MRAITDVADGAIVHGASATRLIGTSTMLPHSIDPVAGTNGSTVPKPRPKIAAPAKHSVAAMMARSAMSALPIPLNASTPTIKQMPPIPATTPNNFVNVTGSGGGVVQGTGKEERREDENKIAWRVPPTPLPPPPSQREPTTPGHRR